MNDIQIFNNSEFGQIRSVDVDGDVWFVGKDVAEALGYANSRKAVRDHVDEEDLREERIVTPSGNQGMTIINESGLYSLVMSSKLPGAKRFKKWVTSEVLPTIRKTGAYAAPQQQVMTPAQLIAAQAQLMVEMEQKLAQIQSQTAAMESRYTEMQQKVETAVRVFAKPREDSWSKDMERLIREAVEEKKGNLLTTKAALYRELEHKCGCDIDARQRCLRQRKKKAGMRHRDAMALTKLDAIGADKQLRAVFESIVREWQARSVTLEGQRKIAVQEQMDMEVR